MALTPDEALLLIQRAGAQNNFEIDRHHAAVQMKARGAIREDVRYGLQVADNCTLQANGRWKVKTVDLDQEQLILILRLLDDVLVITIF
jgi:hypothetical protein